MKNKHTAIMAITAIMSFFMIAAPKVFASYVSITNIKPTENVGLFQKSEDVAFDLTYETAKSDMDGVLRAVDINGNEIRRTSFSVKAGMTGQTVTLGKFSQGWYRVYAAEASSGNVLYSGYTAFCVVPDLADRKKQDNSFAADMAGQEVMNDEQKENYARAQALMGLDMVRERGYWSENESQYNVISKQVETLSNNGVGILEIVSKSAQKDWNENLLNVYNMQKNYSEYYKGKINAWEFVNEPDILDGLTPDLFAAYFKASALGAYDADPSLIKAFGGLCNPDPFYRESMLRNDVLSYSDVYNLHSHATGEMVYTQFGSALLKNGRLLTAAYNNPKPIWVTESGARYTIDENENLKEENFKPQAKYVITSMAESFEAGGTDKHFWFMSRHYTEYGREYGIFSGNDMPYPAVSALSTATYYLGKGEYKGTLKRISDKVKGYVFDTGENDAVVMWSTDGQKNYVQLHTQSDAKIIDMIGTESSRRCGRYHGAVNVPVTDEPIIVLLEGRADERDYYKKSFPKFDKVTAAENMDRVILQPTYTGAVIEGQKYIVEPGAEITAKVTVYNFSDKSLSGAVHANPSEGLTLSGRDTLSYGLTSKKCKELTYTFKVDENASPGRKLYVKYSGMTNDVSDSVTCFEVRNNMDISTAENKTPFDGYYLGANWSNDTSGIGLSKTTQGTTLEMKMTFNGGTRYHYPRYTVSEGSLSDTQGIYFDCDFISGGGGKWGVFARTSTGSAFHTYIDEMTIGKQAYALKWSDLGYYSGPDTALDPANIISVSVGFNPNEDVEYRYVINDFGYFTRSSEAGVQTNEIKIDGIKKNGVYGENTSITATASIPSGLSNVCVYLNYEPYYSYDLTDGIITIDLSGLASGAYNLIVSGRDEFNYCPRDQVSFYVGNVMTDDGVFY